MAKKGLDTKTASPAIGEKKGKLDKTPKATPKFESKRQLVSDDDEPKAKAPTPAGAKSAAKPAKGTPVAKKEPTKPSLMDMSDEDDDMIDQAPAKAAPAKQTPKAAPQVKGAAKAATPAPKGSAPAKATPPASKGPAKASAPALKGTPKGATPAGSKGAGKPASAAKAPPPPPVDDDMDDDEDFEGLGDEDDDEDLDDDEEGVGMEDLLVGEEFSDEDDEDEEGDEIMNGKAAPVKGAVKGATPAATKAAASSKPAPKVNTPATKGKETPAPKGKETPTPKGKETPAPKGKETPAPKGKETPAPKSTTPAAKGKETPAPKGKETPAPKGKETPAPKGKETPAAKGKETPAAKGNTPAPKGKATPVAAPVLDEDEDDEDDEDYEDSGIGLDIEADEEELEEEDDEGEGEDEDEDELPNAAALGRPGATPGKALSAKATPSAKSKALMDEDEDEEDDEMGDIGDEEGDDDEDDEEGDEDDQEEEDEDDEPKLPSPKRKAPEAKSAPPAKKPKADISAESAESTVHIGGLPYTCTEEDLKALFEENGVDGIKDIRLGKRPDGKLTGTCHIDFENPQQAKKAVELDGSVMASRTLKIAPAKPRKESASKGYKEDSQNSGPKPAGVKTVFVGNLPFSINEDRLREVFEECGEIDKIRLITNADGQSKGYGYIEFSETEAVDKAIKKDRSEVDGRPIKVDYETGGGGGGRGGRGDSGGFRGRGRGGRD
eukprot:CAMPEP_0184675714 /NCGR_PEP_ID=MMETSP0308-20130426/87941_1 /TAXON_ID=38269 /ORGANISM="Gloeochaete witrockiana, Strain SAG 46.84" /LENGTH=721 /DNA_ID=CAMNT_0027123451 /DNA_START=46 /DNA_END=2208 /DNA_ORIENTATION=-